MPMIMAEDEKSNILTEQFQAMAEPRASQFITSLVDSSLNSYEGDSWLEIKEAFATEHRGRLSVNTVFLLEGPSGQCWDVRVEKGDTTNQIGFKGGWKMFAYDHRLDQDDRLLFTILEKENKFVVDVFDKCGVPKQSALCAVQNGLPSGLRDVPIPAEKEFLMNKLPDSISAAKEAAEAFAATLTRPTYLSKQSPRSIVRSSLYINAQCSKEWMPKAQYKTITLVDTDGKEWPIFWTKVSGDLFGLGSGWADFSRHHKLKIGDVCLLELVEVNKLINGYIFREQLSADYAGGPQEEVKPKVFRKKWDLQTLQLRHSSLYQKLAGKKKPLIENVESTFLRRPYLKAPRSKRLCKKNNKPSLDFLAGKDLECQDFKEQRRLSPRERVLSEILSQQPTLYSSQVQSPTQTSVETARLQSHKDFLSSSANDGDVRQELPEIMVNTDAVSENLCQFGTGIPTNAEALQKNTDVFGRDPQVNKRKRFSPCSLSTQGRKRSRVVACSNVHTIENGLGENFPKKSHISKPQFSDPSNDVQLGVKTSKISTISTRVMKVATDFITRHPSFTLSMSTGDWRSTLLLPQDFTRSWFKPESSALIILVDASNKHWGATLRTLVKDGVQTLCLQEGWRTFVCAQALEECDACVFELINTVDITFQVHIFRFADVTDVPLQMNEESVHHIQSGYEGALSAFSSKPSVPKGTRGNVRVLKNRLPAVDRPDPESSMTESSSCKIKVCQSKMKYFGTGPTAVNFLYALRKVRADQAQKELEVIDTQ